MPPAPGIHVSQLDDVVADQALGLFGLEPEVLAAVALAVAREDQIDDLFRVVEGIGPALERGIDEGLDTGRVLAEFGLGGEQRVAVEVDAARPRRERPIREARLLEEEDLVGRVGRHRVDLALDQRGDVEIVRLQSQAFLRDALILEIRHQLVGMRLDHDPPADQIVQVIDLVRGDERIGRVLEDGRQRHHRLPTAAIEHEVGCRDAVFGGAAQHGLGRLLVRGRLDELHVQADVAVVALLDRGVVAGKLELMQPFELEAHAPEIVLRLGWPCADGRQ